MCIMCVYMYMRVYIYIHLYICMHSKYVYIDVCIHAQILTFVKARIDVEMRCQFVFLEHMQL